MKKKKVLYKPEGDIKKKAKGGNMKAKVTLTIVLTFFLISCASSRIATKEEMDHEFIVDFPNLTKTEIFDKSIQWIGQNFRSAKDVIVVQNREIGNIIAKAFLDDVDYGGLINGNLWFSLTIDTKDGKARFRFTPISTFLMDIEQPFGDSANMHNGAQKEFKKMAKSLIDFINKDDNF